MIIVIKRGIIQTNAIATSVPTKENAAVQTWTTKTMTIEQLIKELEKIPDKSLPVVIEDTDENSGWTCHEIKALVSTEQTFFRSDEFGRYKCLLLKCGLYE